MHIPQEKINEMRVIIKKIDHSVYRLTSIFFVEFKTVEVSSELIRQIQKYIVKMCMLIPEIGAYLDLIDAGIFDNVESITNRFKLMEEYIRDTDEKCENLLRGIGL